MNDNQFAQALESATKSNTPLRELVGLANSNNFVSQDARKAAFLVGEAIIKKGGNDQAVIAEMGRTYECVLYMDLINSGVIQAPNQQYNGQKINQYQKVASFLRGNTQEQGRTAGHGTDIFTTNQNKPADSIFGNSNSNNATSMFANSSNSNTTSKSDLFGGGNNNNQQANTTDSLFGNTQQNAATAQQPAQPEQQPQQMEPIYMETLACHETEAVLRQTCVSAKRINESVALFKETLIDDSTLEALNGSASSEYRLDVGKRTAITITVMNNMRQFEMGEDSTKRAMEELFTKTSSFLANSTKLASADFSNRMVSEITKETIDIVRAFKEYAENARNSDELDQLTISDATRAQSALIAELYRALDIALSFATEGKGFPNKDATGMRSFELDYSGFVEEISQLEEFYLSYDGTQSSVFELLYCQLARALAWIRISVDNNIVLIGNRELSIEMPFPVFDGFELGHKHNHIDRTQAGENLDTVQDIFDVVESKIPPARMRITDGLYRAGYVDRAYRTCRPKVSLR